MIRLYLSMPKELTEKPKKNLLLAMHRVSRQGGQEKSSLEIFSRLAQSQSEISILSYEIHDWPSNTKVKWYKVPGKNIPIQLIKNLWFSFYAQLFIVLKGLRKNNLICTTGVALWFADVRIIQFVHAEYKRLIQIKKASYPNPKTVIHKIYQHFFMNWTTFLEKTLIPKSKLVIAISQKVQSELKEHFHRLDSKKIKVIHHAPDQSEVLDFIKKENNQKPIILFVGALERKGIRHALNALADLKNLEWTFWAVGDGNLNYWKELSKNLGIENKTTFFGAKPAVDYFKEADIFLFPSTYEPFGLVVSEAASYQLCPIVSKECGSLELWNSKPDWLDLSAFDPKEKWTSALERLIKDPIERKKLSKDFQNQFFEWSWDKAAKKYNEVLL